MAKMRVVQVPKAKGPFEIVEREIPQPGPGEVRIKVQACGVCHSDSLTKDGLFPNIAYPRIPGHEVAGVVDALGGGVKGWKVGDRVGVGWYGGHCGYCDSCRRGNFGLCLVDRQVTGISHDGGYAEYMLTPAVTLALIPDEVSAVDAGPLMCAGVTTFNSLRNSGVGPGEVVAVLGIGGLGHLGVQFAAKGGFKTVAIARGADKAELAKKLGAHVYIDSDKQDVAAELQKLGGAKTILATATSADAMSAAFGGLGIDGKLMVLGVPDLGDPGESAHGGIQPRRGARLVLGQLDRFAGYAALQRADGRASDDAGFSAGKSERSLRRDDERHGAVSRRVENQRVRPSLLVAQSNHGIHAHGATRGDVTGEKCDGA